MQNKHILPDEPNAQARQGDVLNIRDDNADTTGTPVPSPDGRTILAYGEVTGHAHAIRDPGACLLSREGISDRVLTLLNPSVLFHEEHNPIELQAGTYVVRIQREYSPEEIRNVAD